MKDRKDLFWSVGMGMWIGEAGGKGRGPSRFLADLPHWAFGGRVVGSDIDSHKHMSLVPSEMKVKILKKSNNKNSIFHLHTETNL